MEDIKTLHKEVLNSDIARYQEIIDQESFTYIHYTGLDPKSFIHALYITGHENDLTIFNGETYQQLPYDTSGMTVANFA